MKKLLSPFSFLYGKIIRARKTLYEKGILKSYDLQIPTISIGNITVGGTGKTPLVAFTARVLAEDGAKVCILTRGYGRENPRARVLVSDGERILADAREAGDEPFELAKNLLGISAVVADANRAESGNWVRKELGITAFVLDDAFQHLRVKRDLDIICVDATNPFGNCKLLPQGILREPLENLKRTQAVVITRANLVGKTEITNLEAEILELNPQCRIFVSANETIDLIKLRDFPAKPPRRKGIDGKDHEIKDDAQIAADKEQRIKSKYFAFCALGNPESFFEQLRREGFNLIDTQKFPDHHFYTQGEITKLEKEAVSKGAEILLTTAKDAVKLSHLKFNFSCFVVESGLTFDDEPAFKELIQNPRSKIQN